MVNRLEARRAAALVALLLVASGCSIVADRPDVGDTWQIEAVDQAGTFGTIIIERGEIVALPPESRAVARVPGATHGILVYISYEPERASDVGYGAIDWGARPSDEETEADIPGRVMDLVADADWPVGPPLTNKLPGLADNLDGWSVIAVTPQELEEPILLRYQPLIVPAEGAGSGPTTVSEITVHEP